MKELFEQIHEINKIDRCSIARATCKMAEEFGELAQAVNMTIGRKSHDLTKEQIDENITEEAADLIQNAFCVADKRGIAYEQILLKLAEKNVKWKKKVLENSITDNDPSLAVFSALENLMSAVGGGKKKCGHPFECICAWDEAKNAIAEFKKQLPV